MEEQIQDLRSQIADLDIQINELRVLQNDVQTKLNTVKQADCQKITHIETLVAQKMIKLSDADPKKQAILKKVEQLKSDCAEKQSALRSNHDEFGIQIVQLLDKLAVLTKEMVQLAS